MNDILALGAQSKSSFCFVKSGGFHISDYSGDLGDIHNLRNFERDIKKMQKKLKVTPGIIACDLHPEYISSKLAAEWLKVRGSRLKAIQHHKAHVASCIFDNDVEGKVIGIAFDGTGYGLDGNIWGGEFFVGTLKGLRRVAYLKYIPMPGGETAVREPWRMALSYLYNIYGKSFNFARMDKQKARLLTQMIDKGINSPLTSSMGRLFDAVSALTGICHVAKYEGQAAIELERAISYQPSAFSLNNGYNFSYFNDKGLVIVDWAPVIKGIVKDLQAKKTRTEISVKFHSAVCYMIRDVCRLLRKKYKIDKVCMSGGVFQNKFLATHAKPLLEKEDFKVYLHKNLPAHDGNIALGQAILASVQG